MPVTSARNFHSRTKILNLVDTVTAPGVVRNGNTESLGLQDLSVSALLREFAAGNEVPGSGSAVVDRAFVSTRSILERIDAGESVDDVARDYELSAEAVEEAVLFERAA
jgi:hypothetical protein